MVYIVARRVFRACFSVVGTMACMTTSRFFLEDAALLRDDLASVLRASPPDSLQDLEDLEFAIESAVDLEAVLHAVATADAWLLAASVGRVRRALETVRVEALGSDTIRTEAVQALLRRSRQPSAVPDVSAVVVAVPSLHGLAYDARFLVESGQIYRPGPRGCVTSLPRWFFTCVPEEAPGGPVLEEITDLHAFNDPDIVEVALALWDPGTDAPLASFALALEAASRVA